MNMDLINDLKNDLALAFLVERQHLQKIDTREALNLIGRVQAVLQPISSRDRHNSDTPPPEHASRTVSH